MAEPTEHPTRFPSPSSGRPSPLLIHRLLDRPRTWAPQQKITYRNSRELTYTEFLERVRRLGGALTRLGVRAGDRVGVIDWDSHRYLECFFAIPMLGAVLHTINARLSPEQTLFTIRHAEDSVLLVHPDFHPLVEGLLPHLPSVRTCVALPDPPATVASTPQSVPSSALRFAGEYESLLAETPPDFAFPEFDEDTIATLSYTTGTTGDPKGVFFSHRQLVLHTLGAGLGLTAIDDPVGLSADDVYMPLTPMFHVHAWGVPYIATLLGMRQIYPGRYEPQGLLDLITRHRVSFSHCVPTILQMLLNHPASAAADLSHLKVIVGGSALPRDLAQRAMDRGIRIMSGYGMSETCPIIGVAHFKPDDHRADHDRRLDLLTRSGFPVPLAQAAAVSPDDKLLPPGPENTGELVVRAPWLTPGYYRDVERSRDLWRSGWLHTGDLAHLDDEGYIRITDRLKDVIKTGGEWISSLELENALGQHPAVKEVAVVGIADPKWGERPHAEVVLREAPENRPSERDLIHFLRAFVDRGTLHKRAILTAIRFVDAIPKTSVGKVNKRQLRTQLAATAPSTNPPDSP
ncbi:MAG: fatty acid--CoA ligase [Limisphaerales bacterium]